MAKNNPKYIDVMKALLNALIDSANKGECEIDIIWDDRVVKDYTPDEKFTFNVNKGE